MKRRTILAVIIIGLSGIIAQILLLRELLITFYGNELSIGIILANWLILEAAGAFFLGRSIERLKRKLELFIGTNIVFSLSFPAAIYAARIIKNILGLTAGEAVGLMPIIFSSFLILFFIGLTHGALFTFGCKIYSLYSKKDDALSVGNVYIYETLGTIIGGIGLTYLLIPYFHSFQIAFAVSFVNILLCIYLLLPSFKDSGISKITIFLSLIIFIILNYILFTGKAENLHRLSIKQQWAKQDIIYYQNSVYGNVAVSKAKEQYTFFSNGIPVITTPTPDIAFVEEFTHLPMLFHPKPVKVLIISGGAGGIINEVLKHPSVDSIYYAELDPLILNAVDKFTTDLTERELEDKKVNIEYIDGRLFVKTSSAKYDIILVGVSNPLDLKSNRLFTKEFFTLARAKLKYNGIFVIGLPGSLSYIGEELRDLNKCVINTLKDSFPYIRIIPGDTNLFLASGQEEITLIDYAELAGRFKQRNLDTKLLSPSYIEYKLAGRWINWFLKSVEGATIKINRDFAPIGMFYSISYWNALFSPYIKNIFKALEGINLKFFFIVFAFLMAVILFFHARLKRTFAIPACVLTTGFAGMIFNLVLIFAFQVLYGYVFQWAGLLITFIMAGIAGGAVIMTLFLERIKKGFVPFVGIEASLVLFSGLLPLIFFVIPSCAGISAEMLKTIFVLLCFSSGCLIGLEFPLANKIYLKKKYEKSGMADLSGTAGLLYGADLFGGFVGGVAGSVVLFPVLGLFGTCMVVVMLKAVSLIMLCCSRDLA